MIDLLEEAADEDEDGLDGGGGRGGGGVGGGIIAPLEGACDDGEGTEGEGMVVGWCWVGLPVARCWLVAKGRFFLFASLKASHSFVLRLATSLLSCASMRPSGSPEELEAAEPVDWGKRGVSLVCV
jgi:hypothetical protein